MKSFVQEYPLTIAAGGSAVFDMEADGITCIESNITSFYIEVNDGQRATFRRQFEFAAAPGDPIRKLRVINPSIVPLVVTFLVWGGVFRDRRSLLNEVQGLFPATIDEIAEGAYSSEFSIAGVGGEVAFAHIVNPMGSGRTVAVKKVVGGDATASSMIVQHPVTVGAPVFQNNVRSKFVGSPDGVTEVYEATETTVAYTTDANYARKPFAAGAAAEILFTEPLVIPPGESISVASTTLGGGLNGFVEVVEVDG